MEYELNQFSLQIPSSARDNHLLVNLTSGSFIARKLRKLRKRELLQRGCSTSRRQKEQLSHKPVVFSRSEIKYQLVRGFPPLSERRTSIQEDHSCLEYNETYNCSIVPWSSDHPERNLISTLLTRVDYISGKRSRAVSSPETSLGADLNLSKRKVCEKSCGHHLIHSVV